MGRWGHRVQSNTKISRLCYNPEFIVRLTGRRRTEEYLLAWLEDPRLQKPTAHMPKIQLAPDEIVEFVRGAP